MKLDNFYSTLENMLYEMVNYAMKNTILIMNFSIRVNFQFIVRTRGKLSKL